LKGFFENNDTNKDGKLTRDEWDASVKLMSMSKNSTFAVRPGGKGDVSKTHVAWKQTKGVPYVPSPVYHDGVLYMVKDGGQMSAYDAKTGDPVYQLERVGAPGQYYASPVVANGHIYLTALNGDVTVAKVGSSPDVVFRGKLGERTQATPAVVDDTLYVRTAGNLYAFSEQK
jgi:outer membrane protein assembly factor BamB